MTRSSDRGLLGPDGSRAGKPAAGRYRHRLRFPDRRGGQRLRGAQGRACRRHAHSRVRPSNAAPSAIVSEQAAPPDLAVPWARVSDARLALAVLAAEFERHPSREMRVIGITGTNGKTTTAYLVASIFEAAGVRCGVLGTVAYRIGDEIRESTRTTPEASDVQRLLREMVDRGCGACAMEVSSHALVAPSRRRHDIRRRCLHQPHARSPRLPPATWRRTSRRSAGCSRCCRRDAPALINLDDPKGAALVETTTRPVTYAINRAADITPGPLSFSLDGLAFDVRTPRGTLHVRSKLVGRPNVYNILAAISTGVALGLPFDAIEQGVQALAGVPGRFELVSGARDEVTVVVDYAHTDDALRNLLETARPLARGRLITVFGCGGDRDRTKRPLMGAVAGRLSDLIVITSDNPRSEDPERIIEEIRRGITPDTQTRQRAGSPVDRRSPGGDRESHRAGASGRSRARGRQGSRAIAGDWGRTSAVR